jgi:hypothetical protein
VFLRLVEPPCAGVALAALACGWPWPASGGTFLPEALAPWRGEFYTKKQGGLYFKASGSATLDGPLQVLLKEILTKKYYALSKALGEGDGPPRELWKAPSGKYEVEQLVMVDRQGVKRAWKAGKGTRKSFLVKRQSLSNLGLWRVAPEGKTGLAVTFESAPNTYQEPEGTSDSSVAQVIDGATGLVQEQIGGQKVLDAGATDHSTKEQLRSAVVYTRQVSMFFKLDLFRHNRHAREIADVLSTYDTNIRKCYTDRLEWVETLRGDLVFTFLLSKQSGTMLKLKHSGGSIADAKMTECVYYELARISFPVGENMLGELTYTYDVK